MDVLTTPPLPLAEWLSVIEREYLSEFVPAGGAPVKFAILDDDAIGTAAEQLVRLGQARGMLTVHVDAGRTRIHMMHELFFAIARALPWDSLVQRYLEGLFGAHAYAWPRPGRPMTMPDLAAAFAVAPSLLTHRVDQWLTADLWEDRRLAQDFRAALLRSACHGWSRTSRKPPGRCCNGCAARRCRPRRCAPPTSRFAFPAPMRAPCWPRSAISCASPVPAGLLVVLDARRLVRHRGRGRRAALFAGRGDGRL